MRKDKTKILISIGLVGLIGLVVLVLWAVLGGSGGRAKPDALDITELYKVNIYGTQGEGYVDMTLDEGYLEAYIIESGISLTKEDIVVEVSKPNNLSNGDTFTVTFQNEQALEALGAKIANGTGTYTVDGLKEGTEYDVFADLVIYVDGGQVVFDDGDCANFIKDNVDFFIKNPRDTYKEGDAITVGAYVDMNAATDNGYKIEKTETIIIITEQEKTND